MIKPSSIAYAVVCIAIATPEGRAQRADSVSQSVSLRIVGVDLKSAVQLMQPYIDRPVILSGAGAGTVTLETPQPVPRASVLKLLRGLLDAQGYELVDDSATASFRARPRSRALISPENNGSAAPIVEAHRPVAAPELFVIALKHARAAEVASIVNALFGHGTPVVADAAAPRAVPSPGTLVIVPDPHANSLLVRASPADFAVIQSAVEQLDVRPAQALIEVLIVEAQRDWNFDLGVSAATKEQHVPRTQDGSVGGSFIPSGLGLGDFTLHVMGGGGAQLDATIAAAASRGEVRIVSRPVVLTANDEEAEVVVGSQRPFVQVSRTLPTDAATQDQVVQYKDVGTKLTVRPTISVDGTVELSVVQEVSNATSETAFNAPVISTRSIRTNLLVRDSQTVVLGGLTDRERDLQTTGIPILSSIPFLGGLFGSQSRGVTETELFVFITPRVIRNDDDSRRLSDPMRSRAGVVSP